MGTLEECHGVKKIKNSKLVIQNMPYRKLFRQFLFFYFFIQMGYRGHEGRFRGNKKIIQI